MRIKNVSSFRLKIYFLLLGSLFCINYLQAQQTSISDYILFGGKAAAGQTPPAAPGYGVQIGSSCFFTQSPIMGSVGSYKLVKTTGNIIINGNIYSGETIQLANGNEIKGNLAAGSSPSGVPGTIVSIGSNAIIGISGDPAKGNINANGKVTVSGGTVYGKVTVPAPQSIYPYTGPAPTGGVVYGTPTLPTLPQMPAITNFPAFGTTNISSTTTITPGVYGAVNIGNKTLTLNGPGVYVFKSIKTTGPNSKIVYNFNNSSSGNFLIYVHGDIILNKASFSMINGGSATRIYVETHGTGSTNTNNNTAAFDMSNGSNGTGNPSGWLGSLWAPYAAIKAGSPNGPSSTVVGAFWSGTQVNIQGGVTFTFAPFSLCTPPDVNAGPDKPLDFENPTILTGTSATPGVTFNWQAIDGGVITTPANAASITVSAAGSYILTATSTAGCFKKDTAIVTGKVNDIIGSELEAVLQNYNAGGTPSPFFEIQNEKIFIDVIVKVGEYANVKAILTNPTGPWGMTNLLGEDASNFIITGLFPISKLADLNTDPVLALKIVYARPYYRAYNNTIYPTGIISQGDTSVRTHLVRNGYNLSGEGVKIGVLSNSFNTITAATTNPVISSTAAQDIANNDLPGPGNPNNTTPVTVIKESPFVRSDEGRAMLQIIHDIAPKAQLFFRTGVETANDFAAGIRQLKAAGCDIITEDITYITEPFLKDGVVAAAVDEVTAAGTTFISSAGNFANKSFELPYTPMTAPGILNGTAHDFSGGDAFLNVNLTPGEQYTMVLQWVDDIYSQGETATGGTKNDLDIYLTPNTDGTALFGFNRNNLNGDPIEFLPFTYSGLASTNILIINNTTSSNPARFKVVIFRGNITFNEYVTGGSSTIIGQSNAQGTITVGAARFDKIAPYPGPLAIESFSSIGGTIVNGSPAPRNKPDLVAPDGVNTTVNMGNDYANANDPDNNYSNFFGTSAAAPHVAGVAALIMEGKRKFLNQATISPSEMKSLLQSTATDMGTPGFDFSSGYGFINADSAMRTFAKPDPSLIQLVVPQNITPGATPFTLTVTGLNLSPTSTIIFRDSALATTYINSDSATAVVPAFIGDPIISVYTPPASLSGLDGGTSDTLRFFSLPKRNIIISADNKSKKYAQQFPQFTATITVDDTLLADLAEPLSLQQLGLDVMTFTTSASGVNSDVGTYAITPIRVFNPGNPVDIGLLELYNYTFNTGNLSIEKLPVTVTAQDLTVTYNEKLPDIAFNYALTNPSDASLITDPAALLNSIQTIHQNQLAKDGDGNDILGLVNGQAVTIVNGQAIPIVNGQAVTIVNGQAVTIVNGQAIPIVNGQALTIVNGIVTATSPVTLTQPQISNLSFQVGPQSLLGSRTISNQVLVNGTYITSSSKVVDITQESILDYNVNSAQTTMLNSLSNVNGRGLIDVESYTNGQAVTIVNGQAVTIVNGQAVTIVNGQAVTIVNGQAVTIVNGQAIPIVNGQNRTAVVLDQNEIGQGVNQLKSLNMITGFDVGEQYIIPGSLANSNFELTHLAGVVTILPATVTITPSPNQEKVYGTDDPVFTYANNVGLVPGDFSGALGRASGNDVGTYEYTLGTLSAGANYTLSLSTITPVSSFAITARPITITPTSGQSKVYGNADLLFTYTPSEALQPGDAFSGELERDGGETVAGSPYAFALGSLTAGSNYTLSLGGANTFAITTRPITITPTSGQSKVYGNADPLFTYTSSEALQPGDAFSGELGRDGGETVAGSPYAFTLGSLTAGSNYTLSLGGANTFAITTKQVIITPLAGQSKVYGSDDPVFTFSNNGGLAGDVFTGGLGRISGNNVGTYDYTLGNLSAGTNYSLLLSSVAPVPTFAITIKSVTITPVPGQSKVYGTSTDPVFTFTNNAGLSAFDFTGALSRVSGNNAGSYAYTLGNLSAGSNYSLSLSTVVPIATFVITKAPLQVKADLKWINKGSPLPTFTSTITGLKNGDNPTVSYSLSPSCTGSAGVYTIIPLLKPFANSINYTITYTNNYLYINPKGSGADDVDTYLECVEDRGASYMPANRRYVARFYAKNTNSTPVYVPIGVNNSLSSAGSFDGSQQPVVFLPGNGTTRFNVPFDGVTLKWQLKTYEGNYLKTESVTASSSSVKCAINYAPAARGATDESNYEEPPTTAKTSLYPNPATNRVIIITAESVQSEKGIFLYDVYGRYYPVKVIRRISEHSFELDVSGLLNGVYLIRVRGENGYQTLRFVKG